MFFRPITINEFLKYKQQEFLSGQMVAENEVLTRGLRCSSFNFDKDLEKLQNASIFTNIAVR